MATRKPIRKAAGGYVPKPAPAGAPVNAKPAPRPAPKPAPAPPVAKPVTIKPTVNTPTKSTTVGATQVPSWAKNLPSTPVKRAVMPPSAPTKTVTAVNNTRGNVAPGGKAKTIMMAKKGGMAKKRSRSKC